MHGILEVHFLKFSASMPSNPLEARVLSARRKAAIYAAPKTSLFELTGLEYLCHRHPALNKSQQLPPRGRMKMAVVDSFKQESM